LFRARSNDPSAKRSINRASIGVDPLSRIAIDFFILRWSQHYRSIPFLKEGEMPMILFRTYRPAATLAALLFAPVVARGDYMTQTMALNPGGPPNIAGSVQVEAYDGNGAAGGGLSAGQVRLTYTMPAIDPPSGGIAFAGLQSVAFNTDLSLTPSQITLPSGWSTANNAAVGSLGSFNWVAGTGGALQNNVSVLISGLGANATLSHFTLPFQGTGNPAPPTPNLFAGQWVDLSFDSTGPHFASEAVVANGSSSPAPEPSALALAGFGLAGLVVRRRVAQAAGKPAG
jgi:MYXO-CTERM domain-containing protein